MTNHYDDWLAEARQVQTRIAKTAKRGDTLRLELMLLLVEMKQQELVWRTQHPTWKILLRAEKLASYSAYGQFALGYSLLGIQGVEDYGVTATCAISHSPMSYRGKLVRDVRLWFDRRKPRPKHEDVSRYVWRRRRELAPDEFISRGRLTAYIKDLKAKLKDHGIRPPRMK